MLFRSVDVNMSVERFGKLSTAALVIALTEAISAQDIVDVIAASVELGRRLERDDLSGIKGAADALDDLDRVRRTAPSDDGSRGTHRV